MQIETGQSDDYITGERERVKRLFSSKKHNAFLSREAFVEWWMAKFNGQNGCCAYCQTSIRLICELIKSGKLRSRKIKGGKARGLCLELERKDPGGGYNSQNCELVCYYCNNDKSYIYNEKEYKEFFAPARKRHFDYLAAHMNAPPG